jgi:hypothetical protein
MHPDRPTAIALAAVLVCWFFWGLIASKGVFSQETAAWVQALGAIAAIAATGWFATLPLRHAQESARAAKRREITEITWAATEAKASLENIRAAVERNDERAAHRAFSAARNKTDADAALRSWLQVPARDWPNVSVYVRAQALVDAIDRLRRESQLSPTIPSYAEHLSAIDFASRTLHAELASAEEDV